MSTNQKERWEKKGSRSPIVEVMEQARVQTELGREHGARLDEHGWPPESTETLSQRTALLDERYSARASKTDASRNAARTEEECRKEAKAFIKKLRLTVPMVLRDSPEPGITEAAFKTGDTLGMSTPKIAKYLMRVRPFVVVLEESLTPYFGGESPVAVLETVKAKLDASDATQEIYRAGLPVGTKKLHQLAGEVLEMIEDMNRVAELAFQDSPEIAAQFNKSLIQRARRPKRRLELVAEAV
jgi:hypothetical protein